MREAAPTNFTPIVVIPTFNHGSTVVQIAQRCRDLGLPVIIVNDGSTDNTTNRLTTLTEAESADLQILTHPRNRGKAAAIATGAEHAATLGASHVITIDADGQLDPEDIPKLIEHSRQQPEALILGRRPDTIPNRPARCSVGRRAASLALLAQTGTRLSDTQCGLRIYPIGVLLNIRCHASRYAYEAEIIARAIWAGVMAIEVPVGCRYFEESQRISHWKPWQDSIRQAGVHLRLVAESLIPTRRVQQSEKGTDQPLYSRVLHWLNPWRSWRDIRDEEIGDLELGSALAIGAFIGTLPFYGLHTMTSLYVAWRWHLQPAAVVLGSQVSMPPFGIGLAVISIATGHVILHGSLPSSMSFEPDSVQFWKAPLALLFEWFIGSIVVGVLAAGASFAAGMFLARLIRRRKTPVMSD